MRIPFQEEEYTLLLIPPCCLMIQKIKFYAANVLKIYIHMHKQLLAINLQSVGVLIWIQDLKIYKNYETKAASLYFRCVSGVFF